MLRVLITAQTWCQDLVLNVIAGDFILEAEPLGGAIWCRHRHDSKAIIIKIKGCTHVNPTYGV